MQLTEHLRQTFLLVVSILALICFFSSFMLFSCAAYIKIKVDSRMKLIETYNSNVLPAIFLFVGVINLAQNVTCLFVCLKMRSIENREGLMRMLLPILIGGIVLVVFEVSTAIASFVHISILEDEFEAGLKKAMTEYVLGKELKVEMDTVQAEYGCCGDLDYTNWFEYSWLDPQFLKASTKGAKKYFQTDGKYYSDDTPFSCCDVHSPRPCIHHHINDNSKHHNYNYEVETTLYVRGCRIVLMELYSRVLCTVAVIALLIATVKTSALLMFRLLQTSFVLAQETGDWEATTPAYIYYLPPPDADLEQKKLLEGTTSESGGSISNTGSSTENATDENTNNDTEFDDDDDAAAGAAYPSNSNHSHNNYTAGVENISHNKPAWQPLSFTPLIPGTGYLQDDNVRLLSNTDDMALQNRWAKQPLAFQSGSFVADNHNDSYTHGHVGIDNTSVCGENNYATVPGNETDPYKIWAERNMYESGQRLYPTQEMSEVVSSGIPSDSRNMSMSSDKYLMNSEPVGQQVMGQSQKPRLPDDHQGFAGRLFSRLTGSLKPQKKYRDSSKSYKYSLVRTNSDSDEQEEEEDGEDDEEGEEENEAEDEEEQEMCSSEEEYDTNKGINNKGYTLLYGTRGKVGEAGNDINNKYDNSKLEDIQTNVPYQVERRKSETGIAYGNERYPTTDTMIHSQSYYPRHIKDSPCGSDVPVAKSRDATSSSSRASLSSYHEVNEMSGNYKMKQPRQRKCAPRLETDSGSVAKNNLQTRDSRSGEEVMSKSVSFPSTLMAADDLNVNSQIITGLHTSTSNSRLDLRTHGQTPRQGYNNPSTGWLNPSNNISSTRYTEQTDTHIHTADQARHSVHWPKHNRLAELAGTTESSETDYEAASNGSVEDINSHRERFIGRYTPYPYDIRRHNTNNSEEYGQMSSNTRQCREISSNNSVNPLPRERNDFAEVSSTDVPESDNEMSSHITAASTSKLRDHFKGNQYKESKQLSHAQALSKFQFHPTKSQSQLTDEKLDKPASVSYVSRGFSTGHCGEENREHVNISRTYAEHADPKTDVAIELKSGTRPFAFPLMQPSPSSFEMSSSVRNHIRSYQRRSVFIASPISHSREKLPLNSSSPHLTLFSSPLMDSPMETSTPILCTKRIWDSFQCQTLSTTEHDHSSIRSSHHQMEVTPTSDPVTTVDAPKYGDDTKSRQTSFPDVFPSMSGIEKQSLGASNQLLAVEGTLLIDEVYTSSEVCDVIHNVTTTEQSSSKGRVLISPFN